MILYTQSGRQDGERLWASHFATLWTFHKHGDGVTGVQGDRRLRFIPAFHNKMTTRLAIQDSQESSSQLSIEWTAKKAIVASQSLAL